MALLDGDLFRPTLGILRSFRPANFFKLPTLRLTHKFLLMG